MTKQEAIEEMKKGKKITHKHFSSSEWMTIKNGRYLFEDGVVCDHDEFWQWRQDFSWNDGFEFFKE